MHLPFTPGSIFAATSPTCDVPLVPPAYVDDVALPVEAESPADLVSWLAAATGLLRQVVRLHGFEVNLKEGKTEAVLACYGLGS